MTNSVYLVWKVAMVVIVLPMMILLITAVSILTQEIALAGELETVSIVPPVPNTAVSQPTAIVIAQPTQPAVVQGVVLAQPAPHPPPGNKLGKTAGFGDGRLSPIFTKEVQHWRPQILQWAAAYDLDPNIVATLMQIESCGNPDAVSSAGAVGLFQVLPLHFAPGENMTDPATNAQRGLDYFVEGLAYHNGDLFLTFAGYNAGHGSVLASSVNWPQETQQYFYWSQGIYDDARTGAQYSPTLAEWLASRGNSLCFQAATRLGL
ncbi:MAG: transglycosylase SLT domain-containing protein [Anaerolineales bacterium]|nr:transglycosylase SLT domain-containing protein [Anaerolineales bacterium]